MLTAYDLREIRTMRHRLEFAAQQLRWAEQEHRSEWEQRYRIGSAGDNAELVARKARNFEQRHPLTET